MTVKKSVRNRISREVSSSFPEMKGVKPSVSSQGERGGREQYLLVYKGTAELPNGKTMPRVVRVVADEKGKILRMSTSR